MDGRQKPVGILALQGDVSLHQASLQGLGVEPVLVRSAKELEGLAGLVIPGGESTALLRLCKPIGMLPAITAFVRSGGGVFGTCAGAILMASEVTNPTQESLCLIDISIERNGYGRQLESREVIGRGSAELGIQRLPMTFIRAPRITSVADKHIEVLATYRNGPVVVRQNKVLVSTFHPELTGEDALFRYWLADLGLPVG